MASLELSLKNIEDIRRLIVAEIYRQQGLDTDYSVTLNQTQFPDLTISVYAGTYSSEFTINNHKCNFPTDKLSDIRWATREITRILILIQDEMAGVECSLGDVISGSTMTHTYSSAIGLDIKFHKDEDGQRLMIQLRDAPDNVIYALEEGINSELSLSSAALTDYVVLIYRITNIMVDFVLSEITVINKRVYI